MKLLLPDQNGRGVEYVMRGETPPPVKPGPSPARVFFAAAHVTVDPFSPNSPAGAAALDWEATMAFRRHLAGLGVGIAEAMDTAQRGMGLDWPGALELIRRTRAELPDALVFNGAGTDHLAPADARSLDDVERAYAEQTGVVQKIGGRIILMASRALVRTAVGPDDYIKIYRAVIGQCDKPVILHWLGDMFDPALAGYWGSGNLDEAVETFLAVISENAAKIDGVKISLLDKEKEIFMRRRLPGGVKMYTGDDFNYPELIAGDSEGFSHALLGIFDPLAEAAVRAAECLSAGDVKGFREILDPTMPLARLIFKKPTRFCKTGIVFLAWLNGFQNHFVMLGGAQSMRPLPELVETFKLADGCGLLRDPETAAERMKKLLAVYGF